MLDVGDLAPNFSLLDQNGHSITLSDYRGKKNVVVFFYPKDFTPGCTAQSCSFRDNNTEFVRYETQILGISKDTTKSHSDFAKKFILDYPLLADENSAIAKKYGVPKTLGFIDGRATFVVDKNGTIQMAYSSLLKADEHVRRALDAVKNLSNKKED